MKRNHKIGQEVGFEPEGLFGYFPVFSSIFSICSCLKKRQEGGFEPTGFFFSSIPQLLFKFSFVCFKYCVVIISEYLNKNPLGSKAPSRQMFQILLEECTLIKNKHALSFCSKNMKHTKNT